MRKFHEDPSWCRQLFVIMIRCMVMKSITYSKLTCCRLRNQYLIVLPFLFPFGNLTVQLHLKTLSRWLMCVMKASGLDTYLWQAHCSRAAASCYHRKTLSCAELLKIADWSATSSVYKKFYERYIQLRCVLVPTD